MPRIARVVAALGILGTVAIAERASGQHLVQAAVTDPDTAAITPAAVDKGRAIFHGKGTCFACHGPKLEGTQIAPTLKKHAWRDAKNGEFSEIFRIVTHGVKGTVMVSHPGGISDAEALAAASYVWSVSHRDVKP